MEQIIINLSNPREELTLPFSIKDSFDVQISSVIDEILLDVNNFPSFKKIALEEQIALVQGQISLNIVTQSLIPDIDPFTVMTDMDDQVLSSLDIKENINIDSIS